MDDLTFLKNEIGHEYGASDAILKAVLPSSKVIHISDAVSPFKFLETCPLLYHAFEYNAQSRLQANIEASSETAVVSLARYCYTGSYLAGETDGDSILLLQHAETYKIAEDFDVPELQIMAHGNFSCQIEYACCLPRPPEDLLDTIRFIYRHFASDEARRNHNLVDTLLNYCVAVYLYHKLGESLDFLTAVHEIPAFRQDLCRTNIARNFEDDCAADIIRLPSGPMTQSHNAPTTLASRELPSAMLFDLPCKPIPVDATSTGRASFDSDNAVEGDTPMFWNKRNAIDFRRAIPDRSKHSVSPSALAAALQRFTDSGDDTKRETIVNETLRRYKRARIDEATARLEGRTRLPEAGPSNQPRIKEEESIPVKLTEDSYWVGAFGQTETHTAKVATEGASLIARRLLFEYGRPNARPAPVIQLTSRTAAASASTTLSHNRDRPESVTTTCNTADNASEDEGFAIVNYSQATGDSISHTRMSSPELVPAVSIAQTMAGDQSSSDDEWTLV